VVSDELQALEADGFTLCEFGDSQAIVVDDDGGFR
jgi:hypothetical protein